MYFDPHNFTSNWVNPDVCDYQGTFCTVTPDNPLVNIIIDVNLNDANIVGYLPVELSLLIVATLLHINSNHFCDIISQNISRLKLLHELNASNIRFVNPFLDIALRPSLLKYLELRFNDFEGLLLSVLFDKELDAIFLNDNRFSSSMPNNFDNSKAFIVVITNNKIHECLPSNNGNMMTTLNKLVLMNKLSRFSRSFLLSISRLGG